MKINREIDNITHIFNMCVAYKYVPQAITLWSHLEIFLADTTQWHKIKTLGIAVKKLAKENKKLLEYGYICVGALNYGEFWQGDLHEAKKLSLEGLRIGNLLKDKTLIAHAQLRLGRVYQIQNKLQESEKLLSHSLLFFQSIHDQENVIQSSKYLGENYILANNVEVAYDYLQKALILSKQRKNIIQQSFIISILGALYFKKGELKTAKEYFLYGIRLEKIYGRRMRVKIWNCIGLGLIALKEKNTSVAQRYVTEAIQEIHLLQEESNIKRVHAIRYCLESSLVPYIGKSHLYKDLYELLQTYI